MQCPRLLRNILPPLKFASSRVPPGLTKLAALQRVLVAAVAFKPTRSTNKSIQGLSPSARALDAVPVQTRRRRRDNPQAAALRKVVDQHSRPGAQWMTSRRRENQTAAAVHDVRDVTLVETRPAAALVRTPLERRDHQKAAAVRKAIQ